jgi:hypothetical protein
MPIFLVLGFISSSSPVTVRGQDGITTRNIHFYDDQLSSLKEPNSL